MQGKKGTKKLPANPGPACKRHMNTWSLGSWCLSGEGGEYQNPVFATFLRGGKIMWTEEASKDSQWEIGQDKRPNGVEDLHNVFHLRVRCKRVINRTKAKKS